MKRLCWIPVLCLVATAAFAQAPASFTGPNPSPPQAPHKWEGPPLWDNGITDGSNGYSNAVVGAFGARRTLLDDFVIPGGETWSVEAISWTHVWNTLPAGSGTGEDLQIVADGGGSPDVGTVIGVASVNTYTEIPTGGVFFSRPEAASTAEFDPIIVAPGTYWIEHTVVGPENNFHLIKAAVTGNELWVNYDDLGGLQSGTQQFGVPADLNYALFGSIVVPVELQGFDVE